MILKENYIEGKWQRKTIDKENDMKGKWYEWKMVLNQKSIVWKFKKEKLCCSKMIQKENDEIFFMY
jgi:hypothetical protein